ncbi:e3 ubiquitin-protein ligase ccnb1ip1 [Colletotrichum incanum]|uniref:E3 ubiquitin-protein ligase ccnb1ip1 n=1 Tax=Colletotrichum incanum TaxID=1573173 RepID=A0A161WAK3_COLIC|nr:e3 ubiquitin-protein ligase ccnb1ip1 [Colletotrichum incanum]
MEHTLKCNVLKCRKELGDQALVTTCSHIFCAECSNRHGLTGPVQQRRNACPACSSRLTKPGDAVVANLNLTEDYKTSVLSGLSPNVIMECAGRALSFWAYQTTQEIPWTTPTQRLRASKKKYKASLLARLPHPAWGILANIPEALSDDCDGVRRKHEELAYAYQDKCRILTQVQGLYDRVKRKAELEQMAAAALDAVDSSLQHDTHVPDSNLPEPTATLNIHEQQTEPENYGPPQPIEPDRGHRRAYVGKGQGAFLEDIVWSRPKSAQGRSDNDSMLQIHRLTIGAGDVVQTPRRTLRGHGVRSQGRFGLLMGSGLAVGTPSTRGPSGVLGNVPNPRNLAVPRGYGLGIGLSSGIRTSNIRHGNYDRLGSRGQMEHNAAQSYPRGSCLAWLFLMFFAADVQNQLLNAQLLSLRRLAICRIHDGRHVS